MVIFDPKKVKIIPKFMDYIFIGYMMLKETTQESRVVKPDPGVDPDKEPGPGFYGSTRVNP
jgi:hypothetical protein